MNADTEELGVATIDAWSGAGLFRAVPLGVRSRRGTCCLTTAGIEFQSDRGERRASVPWDELVAVRWDRQAIRFRVPRCVVTVWLGSTDATNRERVLEFLREKLAGTFDLRPRPAEGLSSKTWLKSSVIALFCMAFLVGCVFLQVYYPCRRWAPDGWSTTIGVLLPMLPLIGLSLLAIRHESRFPRWRRRHRKYDVLDWPPSRICRHVRFSLRTLLFAFLVLSVPLSWFSARWHQATRQRQAVQAIMRDGSGVQYDYEDAGAKSPAGPVWLRNLLGDNFFAQVVQARVDPDVAAEHLTALHGLRKLTLLRSNLTDADVARLQALPQLRTLELHLANATDADLERCAELKPLSSLGVGPLYAGTRFQIPGSNHVTDAGLRHLAKQTGICRLFLPDTQVTDAGLESLQGLINLQQLDLSGTRVTDAGLVHLHGMTQLTDLFLNRDLVTDAGLEHLKERRSLMRLELRESRITDAGLKHLPGLTGLGMLFLDGTQVTDAGLHDIQRLSGLGFLGLSRTAVTDAGVAKLQGLRQLQSLSLANTQVTVAGLRTLQALPQLAALELGGPQVTDESLACVAQMGSLGQLYLQDAPITDAGLQRLHRKGNLRFLFLLGDTPTTDAGIRSLKKAIPGLIVSRKPPPVEAE